MEWRTRWNRIHRGPAVGAVLALAVGVHPGWAGNDGFFTTYNSEIEAGELELMVMNDETSPSEARRGDGLAPSGFQREGGLGDYFSHMVELEYGVSNRFATEFMVEWFEDLDTGERRFSGSRWESRLRLFEDPVPLNPMVYAEYEDLDPRQRYKMEVSGWVRPPYSAQTPEPDRERILETRLIFSDAFGPVDWAVNWINETEVTTGYTAFGYSMGLMRMVHGETDERDASVVTEPVVFTCPMHREVRERTPGRCPKCGMALVEAKGRNGDSEVRACSCGSEMKDCRCGHCRGESGSCACAHQGAVGFGVELFGALGDSKRFGLDPSRQEHYLGPILMYHVDAHLMVHTQLGLGLSRASDQLARLNVGYEF